MDLSWDSWQALQTNGKFILNLFRIKSINGQKTENIQTNNMVWILIKVQCVIYQWIRLNKLYKLMESFFSHFGIIFLN